ALAEQIENAVLVVDEKATPAALKKLLRLKRGDQAVADELGGERRWQLFAAIRLILLQGGAKPALIDQAALADDFNESIVGRQCRHSAIALAATGLASWPAARFRVRETRPPS